MKKITSEWLDETNAEFDGKNIDANDRATLAEKKFRREFTAESKVVGDFKQQWEHLNTQIDKIRSYFLTQTNAERGNVRAQFFGTYYFRGTFCEVVVPIVMGLRGIDPFKYIFMPPELCEPFRADKESGTEYVGVYADTYDYGYGIEEVAGKCTWSFPKELFRSSDKHLRSCISLLGQEATSSKAIEDARTAVEISLKAFMVMKKSLTDTELKEQFGHRLDKLCDGCIAHGLTELTLLRKRIISLPGVEVRYKASQLPFGELWNAYRLALSVSVAVLRGLGGRDCRAMFKVDH